MTYGELPATGRRFLGQIVSDEFGLFRHRGRPPLRRRPSAVQFSSPSTQANLGLYMSSVEDRRLLSTCSRVHRPARRRLLHVAGVN